MTCPSFTCFISKGIEEVVVQQQLLWCLAFYNQLPKLLQLLPCLAYFYSQLPRLHSGFWEGHSSRHCLRFCGVSAAEDLLCCLNSLTWALHLTQWTMTSYWPQWQLLFHYMASGWNETPLYRLALLASLLEQGTMQTECGRSAPVSLSFSRTQSFSYYAFMSCVWQSLQICCWSQGSLVCRWCIGGDLAPNLGRKGNIFRRLWFLNDGFLGNDLHFHTQNIFF